MTDLSLRTRSYLQLKKYFKVCENQKVYEFCDDWITNGNNASESDGNTAAKDTTEEVDQSKIDYQLARALDLIQGVAIFTKDKPSQ